MFRTEGISETDEPFSIDFDNPGTRNDSRVTYKYFGRESSEVRLNANSIAINLDDDARTSL